MLIVVARLVHLQFSQHETLAERAKQQQQNAIETTAQRGELLDRRNDNSHAACRQFLYLDPKGLDAAELECTAFEVSRALRLDEANC